MKRLIWLAGLIVVGLSLGGSGCKRQEKAAAAAEAEAVSAAMKLRGASEVMAALENKDYQGAVRELVRVSQSIRPDQQLDFLALSTEVKNKLLEMAPTDPKAAEALAALRIMKAGR